MVRSHKQEPRVSTATYIQSLVKPQLGSSTTMTTTTDSNNNGGKTQTQTHKKQVRRRLHTSRPYQERLLNMAEARREIVTALKQHRASMRQAAKIPPPPPQNLFSPPPPPPPPPDPFSWCNPHLNLLLPNQPLGLNLNFHDFNDFIQTSSSSSSSTSSSSSSSTIQNTHIYSSPSPPPPTFATASDPAPHRLPVDNVGTSAWWSELMMKTAETEMVKSEEQVVVVEDDVFPKFNDVMEFPSWLNPTDEELFHPYDLTTHYSSSHNPPLSCMDIKEIEGMDGDDWLAWLSHKD
ncbi:hypothetical protein Bca52824_036460 [Brassica carinata]|uniref:Uncharacterized protein n=1 Tax=Brassica carinata TaxID=52824 RepID=A0A8X7S607_BRACI|nr:hypothetical protein Bca52824_036460 [Brassica carinata]